MSVRGKGGPAEAGPVIPGPSHAGWGREGRDQKAAGRGAVQRAGDDGQAGTNGRFDSVMASSSSIPLPGACGDCPQPAITRPSIVPNGTGVEFRSIQVNHGHSPDCILRRTIGAPADSPAGSRASDTPRPPACPHPCHGQQISQAGHPYFQGRGRARPTPVGGATYCAATCTTGGAVLKKPRHLFRSIQIEIDWRLPATRGKRTGSVARSMHETPPDSRGCPASELRSIQVLSYT